MKSLAISAGCLLALVLIGLGVWGYIDWQDRSARNLAVAEQRVAGDATIAASEAQARAAAQTILAVGETRDRLDLEVHQANDQAIAAAPGASAPLDPALNAVGRAGLCRHAAYAADPGCAGLRVADPAVVPAADPAHDAP